MSLRANAPMQFTRYETLDNGLVRLWFVSGDPGPGEASDYDITLTDAQITEAANAAALRTLAQTALDRKYRGATIAAKLDPVLGAEFTV